MHHFRAATQISKTEIHSEPLMPSAVFGWTTAAIFYFVHNIFWSSLRVPSLSAADWHFDRRWSCAQVNASTPTTTTMCASAAHRFVSVAHQRRMEKWIRVSRVCALRGEYVRSPSFTHTHPGTRTSTHWRRICLLGRNGLSVYGLCESHFQRKERKSFVTVSDLPRLSECKYVRMQWTVLELKRNDSHVVRRHSAALATWMINECYFWPKFVDFFRRFESCDGSSSPSKCWMERNAKNDVNANANTQHRAQALHYYLAADLNRIHLSRRSASEFSFETIKTKQKFESKWLRP